MCKSEKMTTIIIQSKLLINATFNKLNYNFSTNRNYDRKILKRNQNKNVRFLCVWDVKHVSRKYLVISCARQSQSFKERIFGASVQLACGRYYIVRELFISERHRAVSGQRETDRGREKTRSRHCELAVQKEPRAVSENVIQPESI